MAPRFSARSSRSGEGLGGGEAGGGGGGGAGDRVYGLERRPGVLTGVSRNTRTRQQRGLRHTSGRVDRLPVSDCRGLLSCRGRRRYTGRHCLRF